MSEQTTSSIVVAAEPAAVMAVIADFAAYPEWAKGVKRTEIQGVRPDGRAERVHFVLDVAPIKDSYTLAYRWDGDRRVTWSLAESQILRALDGSYELRTVPGGTEVTYQLVLDLNIPIIGMLKRKGEKVIIETALAGLKKRVESLR